MEEGSRETRAGTQKRHGELDGGGREGSSCSCRMLISQSPKKERRRVNP